ncbi:MAG TPA: methylated-DNA--[protein]-cysteine S-methyltransferase [Actinomycetales bacterium]|nr:methylated-DNA--[protein]-cysteine S-methyltransferase [Actinomycetales bacterium]
MTTWWTLLPSPVDDLLLTTDGSALTGVFFSPHKGIGLNDRLGNEWVRDDDHSVLRNTAGQLQQYFARERKEFELELAPPGTGFQRRVWDALCAIPFGETRSYGEIAAQLGLPPGASRAVGLANGANPISIVVPCHRVIGTSGALTGYGGGLERKRFLLDLEADLLF